MTINVSKIVTKQDSEQGVRCEVCGVRYIVFERESQCTRLCHLRIGVQHRQVNFTSEFKNVLM